MPRFGGSWFSRRRAWLTDSTARIAARLPVDTPTIHCRPFCTPHHPIRYAGLVGGGRVPGPGEISLADRAFLILDELPEFGSQVLEMLRRPLEDKRLMIARSSGSLTFPSNLAHRCDEPLPMRLLWRSGAGVQVFHVDGQLLPGAQATSGQFLRFTWTRCAFFAAAQDRHRRQDGHGTAAGPGL